MTHLNLNDQTCEGFFDPKNRVFAVQYHPEASPGPHDSVNLFAEFRSMLAACVGAETTPVEECS